MSMSEADGVLEDLLDLEELDTNLYRAGNPAEQYMPHLYGGQVAAQALRAAANTVPEGRYPHSIHGYFLRGGRPDRPDDHGGRPRPRRRLVLGPARERAAGGRGDLQRTGVVPRRRRRRRLPASQPARRRRGSRLDARVPIAWVTTPCSTFATSRRSRRNPGVRAACGPGRAACSRTTASPGHARSPTSPTWGGRSTTTLGNTGIAGPSLDHAVWFHRSVTVNQWVLLDLYPVSVAGARGVYVGTIHDRAGTLAASLAQEKLLRPPRPRAD